MLDIDILHDLMLVMFTHITFKFRNKKLPMDNYDNYLGTISFIVGNGYRIFKLMTVKCLIFIIIQSSRPEELFKPENIITYNYNDWVQQFKCEIINIKHWWRDSRQLKIFVLMRQIRTFFIKLVNIRCHIKCTTVVIPEDCKNSVAASPEFSRPAGWLRVLLNLRCYTSYDDRSYYRFVYNMYLHNVFEANTYFGTTTVDYITYYYNSIIDDLLRFYKLRPSLFLNQVPPYFAHYTVPTYLSTDVLLVCRKFGLHKYLGICYEAMELIEFFILLIRVFYFHYGYQRITDPIIVPIIVTDCNKKIKKMIEILASSK
ncbi:hypothetical protein QTP88_007178 [Uroleucon formosanum]